jgi:hypothetical protein
VRDPSKDHAEGDHTVALSQFDLSELRDALRAGGDVDLIRSSVEMVLQALIDAEATEVIGAGRHERWELRTNQRNGIRPKLATTKAGDVELAIPKLRHGSFCPSILERRRGSDRALFAVVMAEHTTGIPTLMSEFASLGPCETTANTAAAFAAIVSRSSCDHSLTRWGMYSLMAHLSSQRHRLRGTSPTVNHAAGRPLEACWNAPAAAVDVPPVAAGELEARSKPERESEALVGVVP